MKIKRSFNGMTDRYAFDFGPCTYANGLAQIDTKQDASYFGTWCNPDSLKIVNYCEGDITVKTADNAEEFAAEIRDLAAWNDKHGWGPMKIDKGLGDEMAAKFEAIGLEDLLH